jgi:hypothetical protein
VSKFGDGIVARAENGGEERFFDCASRLGNHKTDFREEELSERSAQNDARGMIGS